MVASCAASLPRLPPLRSSTAASLLCPLPPLSPVQYAASLPIQRLEPSPSCTAVLLGLPPLPSFAQPEGTPATRRSMGNYSDLSSHLLRQPLQQPTHGDGPSPVSKCRPPSSHPGVAGAASVERDVKCEILIFCELKRKMSGFGHRVYKNYDPRAKLIRKLAEEVFSIVGRDPLIEVAVALEKAALSNEYFINRKLYPNGNGIPYRIFPCSSCKSSHGWLVSTLEGVT